MKGCLNIRPAWWVLAAVAVVITVLVSWLIRPGEEADLETAAPRAEAASTSDGATLPVPGSYLDGHPTNFPRTELGAVAAHAGSTAAQAGFDYDTATRTTQIYSAPADQGHFAARARSAVEERRNQAGVGATGEAPAPAAYAVTPLAFTTERLGDDYYAVNLLSYVTLTSVNGTSHDGLYAGTQLLRWVEGDWKVVRGTPEDLERLTREGQPPAVAPGTPEFAAVGWTLIEEETP